MQEIFGEPVTFSATGKPQRLSDVPVTMEILTSDDIRRSGVVDLAEVLRQVNGVNVLQSGPQNYDVSVRGNNQGYSQSMLVLVNGRQVYLDQYGFTAWQTIPVQLEEIQQIEVVKGPNTALFGFNAASGVINIVTFNPIYDEVSTAAVTLGTHDYREARAVHTEHFAENFGVRFSASKREANPYNSAINGQSVINTANGKSILMAPERQTINLDALYKTNDTTSWRVELSNSHARDISYGAGSALGTDYETTSGKISYTNDSDYGLIVARLYQNRLDFALDDGVSARQSIVKNIVTVAALEDTIELNNSHTARFGTEFRRNRVDSSDVLMNDQGLRYDNFAFNTMWNWQINDDWSWTNAGRIDYLNLSHSGPLPAASIFTDDDFEDTEITALSYNSGLVWNATTQDTLRLSSARGVEVPSIFEFGLSTSTGGQYLSGNPHTDPTITTSHELAWDRRLDSIEKGLLRAAIFQRDTKDVKSVQAQLVGANVYTNNIGSSSTHGAELSLEGVYKEAYEWGLGYIFQQTRDDLQNRLFGNPFVPKAYEDTNPSHEFKVKLGYHDGPWEADTLAYYVSQTRQLRTNGTAYESIKPYVGLNARIAYEIDEGFTAAIHGNQLQSASTQTTPLPDIERRVFFTLTKRF